MTLIGLPPYSPELNPIENLWLYLRCAPLVEPVYEDWDALKEAATEGMVAVGTDAELIKTVCAAPYIAGWDAAVIY